ncbi:hypothetical protein SAMD00023353_6500190 [Rosellinia necatrix]|uniref:Mtf2-like C-terminal domain-containing protein n=1 Tax=Rosellinia necatrix TaxID=77044 RepID=A0A1W2TSQ9_ROSNE|nr:hypothetical protein SAMD00023353_6500190 [Rosellinia necatrix]
MPPTLMPFLYQTRTILRIPAHRASAGIVRSLHGVPRRPVKEGTIPFDYEVGTVDQHVPDDEGLNQGTITPSERQIFERIFADIEARSLQPVADDQQPKRSPRPSRSARLIMQQAAHDFGQGRPATVAAPGLLSGAANDRAKALLRFPPQLRSAASKALDTIKQQALSGKRRDDAARDANAAAADQDEFVDDDWKAPAHSFARTVELEAKRQPERSRIEGLITAAASDFELWDILETEVFTMPARLGIVKGAPESDDAEPTPESAEQNATPKSSDDVPNPGDARKLRLYVHGPLYPAYLLLALRRLETAFSAPSPLVFSILPRIKELGLESYVLGVSTPFYNQLLSIYWKRHGDLAVMLDLLEEMRHCGLYFDKQTLAILNRVDASLTGLAKGTNGGGLGIALMRMPEYERSQRNRLRYWHKAVYVSAQERQSDMEFTEAVDKIS